MAMTATRKPPPRHPWLEEFAHAPQAAFGELLAGYAKIHPYGRADPPDAARMLFGPLPPNDPVRQKLGPAILGWLGQRRREAPPADRPRLQHWVAEICEAFEIVSFLEVADAAAELRQRFVVWNEWTAEFSLSPARDAHAEYWRMLALTQPLLSQAAATDDPAGLAPLWLEICRQAGGALPKRYLGIGLLGLRRLPDSPAGSEAPWVAGLAHWALAQNPSDAAFRAEWLALKPLYPRTAERWRQLVGRLLATKAFQDRGIEAPAWWRGDPDFAPMTREAYRVKGEPLRSPGPEACNAVMQLLDEPWERVERAIEGLMQAEHRFLSATGDSQFFVRTMHRLGTALIERGGDEPHARARKAQALAQEGIGWQPYRRHLWSLWRDALAADGALEAAELWGWEAIRRDPDHVDARTQLATLLAEGLGRPADAEALLRDTIAAFPQNPFARNQLATLLADGLGRPADAEALLRDTIAAFPQDPFARTQLAELLIAADRVTEAEAVTDAAFAAQAVGEATYALRARLQTHRGLTQDAAATLREGLGRFPSNAVLRSLEQFLDRDGSLRLQSAAQHRLVTPAPPPPQAAPPDDPAMADLLRYGRLRQLRSGTDSADPAIRQAALDEVQAILRDDPTFAYAELLAARHGLCQAKAGTLPPFAAAFEQALREEDRASLEDLAKRQPRLEALTLVARAVLGDAPAAWLVHALLTAPAAPDDPRILSLLRTGLKTFLEAASVPRAFLDHSAAIRRRLYDVNEALLGDRIAA